MSRDINDLCWLSPNRLVVARHNYHLITFRIDTPHDSIISSTTNITSGNTNSSSSSSSVDVKCTTVPSSAMVSSSMIWVESFQQLAAEALSICPLPMIDEQKHDDSVNHHPLVDHLVTGDTYVCMQPAFLLPNVCMLSNC
jgi:hypothetical protein